MADYMMTIKRVYRRSLGANFDVAITTTWTDGSSVTLENVVDFDPDGGIGVFEPGTAREEVFEYGGVDEQTEQLTEVVRPNTLYNHAAGTFVQEGASATVQMLADGYLEDEEHPVVGVLIPPEYEMTLKVGVRDVDEMETIPISIDDEEDFQASGAPVGTPLVLRTDTDGVTIDSENDTATIGASGSFFLDDVAGSPPAGRAGSAIIFYDSLGGSGAGIYKRLGTAAPTLL